MEHSAEWLRGAYRIASRYAPMDVVMQINVQLAAAEAREAGEPSAADELIASKNETEQVTALYDEEHEKLTMAESEIVRLNDVLQKTEHTAADVIREAKAALEIAQQASGSRLFHDSRRKALTTISAWEAGNDLL